MHRVANASRSEMGSFGASSLIASVAPADDPAQLVAW
jgi:hypothetical protein